MTEFQRLCESSPNQLTRELLQAGLTDRAPERGAERALLALGVGVMAQAATAAASAATAGAATASGTAAASAAASAGTAVAGGASGGALLGSVALAKLFALGVAGGIGVAGGAAWLQHDTREPAPVVRAVPAPPRAAAPRPAARALEPSARAVPGETSALVEGPGTPEPTRVEPGSGARAPEARGTAPNEAASAAQPSPPQNPVPELPAVAVLPRAAGTLAREVALIDAARQALNAGAPPRALAELERYDRERVTGTLDREALLIRIDALALSGQRAKAADLARDYLARYPKDAHGARLGALVSEP